MANYTSRPIELTPVTGSFDFKMINQVLAVKQGKYDVAKQNVQQGISALENIKVLRPEDQEYIDLKVQNMITDLNGFGDKNLSNGTVADSYYNAIRSVTRDPIVGDAIANTMKYSAFQTQMSELQKKGDGKYNDLNYQYALSKAGMEEYKAGKTNSLGSFNYSNYSDYNKNLLDRLKVLKDLKGDTVIQIQGNGLNGAPVGGIIEKKLSGLTAEEIIQHVPGMMSAEDENQIRIEGWGMSKSNPQGVEEAFTGYKTQVSEDYDSQIEQLKAIRDNDTNSNDKKSQAITKLKQVEKEKEDFVNNSQNPNLENKGYMMKRKGYLEAIAGLAAAKENISIVKDEVYYANENLINERMKIDQAERKLAMEKQKLVQDNTSQISTSPMSGELQKELNPAENLLKEHEARENNVIGIINSVYTKQSTPLTVKREYEASMKRMGYSPDGTQIDPTKTLEYDAVSAMTSAFEESNMGASSPEEAKNLVSQKALYDNIAQDYASTQGEAVTEYFKGKNIDREVEEIAKASEKTINTGNTAAVLTAMVFGAGEEEGRGKLRSFLNKEGGKNIAEKLAKSPKKAREFLKILEETSGIGKGFLSRNGLVEKAKAIAGAPSPIWMADDIVSEIKTKTNAKIQQKNESKQLLSMSTANVFTESNPKVIKDIINTIPTISGVEFDDKKNISMYKTMRGDKPVIIITQTAGYGQKEGLLVDRKPKEVVLDSEDAGFKYINNMIDLDESNRGLDATRTNAIIKSNKRPSFQDATNKPLVEKLNNHLNTTLPNEVFSTRVLLAKPQSYLTKQSTLETYTSGLKNMYTPEEINTIVGKVTNNIGNYKLELSPSDGNWVMNLKDANNISIRRGKIGQQYLDASMIDLVKNYPQTLILDYILQNLREDRDNLKAIIK